MKTLEKIFLKMSGREQTLLVVSLWVVFLLCFLQVIQISFQTYTAWKLNEETINGHRMILGLKPAIDAALEQQNKNQLSNLASELADRVFPQRSYNELDSDERERYKQHRVRVKFQKASYEDVNEYAALVRQESPYMFLSEVKIEPNYPPKSRPYDPTTFDATFEVSSVEFLNP